MNEEIEPCDEEKDLIEIANIQIRIEAIVTAVIQARGGIAELHAFLAACGYGDSLSNLRVMESHLSNMARTLTEMNNEY